jgi:hypothetical protein
MASVAFVLMGALGACTGAPGANPVSQGTCPGPNVDWHGCNKHDADLRGAHLLGANVYGVKMAATHVSHRTIWSSGQACIKYGDAGVVDACATAPPLNDGSRGTALSD